MDTTVALLRKVILHAGTHLPAPELDAFLAGMDENDLNWAEVKLAETDSRQAQYGPTNRE